MTYSPPPRPRDLDTTLAHHHYVAEQEAQLLSLVVSMTDLYAERQYAAVIQLNRQVETGKGELERIEPYHSQLIQHIKRKRSEDDEQPQTSAPSCPPQSEI